MNPFRYRGYYLDTETNLYYLQSRYYDAYTGRFINADGQLNGGLLGYNLFAYCENNPVMYTDPTGEWPDWNIFVKGALLVAFGVGVAAATILTAGTATLCLAGAIAATAVTSAALCTAAIGASEVVESLTGTNVIRDAWGEDTYETVKNIALAVTSFGAAYLSGGGTFDICFVAGTPVAAQDGLVPIEEIQPGDLVWATNEETGETELKEVVQIFRNETEEWVHVTVNGEKITCTPNHPFYSPVKGWTSAINLRAGDILVMLNGEYVVVEQVQHELLESPETTYNFEVADFHTYYVGDKPVLVHNSCGMSNSEATATAQKMGYSKVNGQTSHGKAIFVNSKAPLELRYITADADAHNGGIWKAASSIENLFSKRTRSGTYDIFLRRVGK